MQYLKEFSTIVNRLIQPTVIRTLGTAFLTILIPLAIAILQSIYRKRGTHTEFADLDLHVVLDCVFKIKHLLFYVCLIFVPMLLWEAFPNYRIVISLMSVMGIVLLGKIIYRGYKWVKGHVFRFRFSYLRHTNKHKDLETAWCSVWKVRGINVGNELSFFNIFSSKVNNLLIKTNNKENLKTVYRLLEDFLKYIDLRSLSSLVKLDIFSQILEWHKRIFKKTCETESELWSLYGNLYGALNCIIKAIMIRSFKEKHFIPLFFETFRNHVQKYASDVNYIESLVDNFAYWFFHDMKEFEDNLQDVWNAFPREWKITKDNYVNPIPKIFWGKFLQWAQRRILQATEKQVSQLDQFLDSAVRGLFPEVDPISWSTILIFAMSPPDGNKVKSAIERPWTFGLLGRPSFFPSQSIIEERKAIELAHTLFPEVFTEEKLRDYIKDLKSLKYEKGSREIRRRQLLRIFEKMLELKSMEHKK